jgi:iron complex outermembrane recepter protein
VRHQVINKGIKVRSFGKSYLICSSVLPFIIFAMNSVHAQQTSAAAQTPADQTTALEEVVVTAERRAEPLQNVPIAVSVVSASTIANLGLADVTDLNMAVPGVNVRQSAAFSLPYIRGVGSATKTPLDEPPVGMYVDDVYVASQTNILTFNNIKDVEVDKGPQGTLFGRNTTGGVIGVTTADPTSQPTGGFHVGYGNYSTVSGDGYVSGGIADHLAADLAVVGSGQEQGFGRNLTTGDYTYQNDFNYALRSKVLYTPDDADRILIIADYSAQKNSMSDPSTLVPGSRLSPGVVAPTISANPYDIKNNVQPLADSQSGGASLQMSHNFDSGFLVKSITAYRQGHLHQDLDVDGTAAPVFGVDGIINDHEVTEELQAQSSGSGPFSWTTGLFYFSAASMYDPNTLTLGTALAERYYERFTADSVAGYAQGTYAVTPDTHLTAGARYTYESRDVSGDITKAIGGGSPVLLVPPGFVDRTVTVDKPSYRVSADHKFGSDVMVYASYNYSFKSGGFSAINQPAYQPETLGAYEVGLKSQLFDRRVTLNLSGFYYDYKDIQVQQITLSGTLVTNAGAARNYGLDADLNVQLIPNLSLTSGLELLNAKYTSFANAPLGAPLGGGGVTAGSATGNYLPFAPEVTANVGLVHTMPLAGGEVKSSLLAYFSSRYYAQPDNIESQTSYVTMNGSILWEGASGLSVKLWANNITNRLIMGNATDAAPAGDWLITYLPPRTYGITLGYKL